MKENHKELVGVFRHLDSLLDSMNRLRKMGLQDFIVLSPVPHHEIEKALGEKRGSIRLFTLIGALVGCAGGFGLAIFAALNGD